MSKYERLWEHIKKEDRDILLLSFEEIEKIAGVPIDHSFLNYKKELFDHTAVQDSSNFKMPSCNSKALLIVIGHI